MRLEYRFDGHTHTEISNAGLGFPDSINRAEVLIKTAMKKKHCGIAITDHGVIGGHVKAVKALADIKEKLRKQLEENKALSKKEIETINTYLEFKLALGCEIYLSREGLTADNVEKGEKYHHMILIAKNKKGWNQLAEISSIGWQRSFTSYGIERTPVYPSDLEKIISEDPGNLIATTACLGGYLGNTFTDSISGKITKKEASQKFLEHTSWLIKTFGTENSFLEMSPAQYPEQIAYNKMLLSLSKKTGLKYTIATDSHYPSEDKREVHKAFLESDSKNKKGKREVDEFYKYCYLMDSAEVYDKMEYLGEDVVTEGIKTSLAISRMCENYSIFHSPIIPARNITEKDVSEVMFEKEYEEEYPTLNKVAKSKDIQHRFFINQVERGLNRRNIPKDDYEKHFKRIELEASELWAVSEALNDNMFKYQNLIQMVIDFCWNEGNSLVGPSRGSAFGFLSHYLMGITNVSPFFNDKIPAPHWRFLNKERIGLPKDYVHWAV